MRIDTAISRALSVVDRTLRKEFPRDYDKRCIYAAFAICALLHDLDIEANIVGGDFVAFVVSQSGDRAGLQGFGNAGEELSHYWVAAADTIIDVGPHYLPKGSSFQAANMPLVAWSPMNELPLVLRYRPKMRFASQVELRSSTEIQVRKELFVSQCTRRYNAQLGQPKLPTWLLTGLASLELAARSGDFWARNALLFADRMDEAQLPF